MQANSLALKKATLPFEDKRDFDEAGKGFIAAPPFKQIMADWRTNTGNTWPSSACRPVRDTPVDSRAVLGACRAHHPQAEPWRPAPAASRGRQCRDTFLSLKKTSRKLGVSFWQYLLDRIQGIQAIPPLPELVRQRANDLAA